MRRGHVAEQRLRSSRLVLKTAATRGSARDLRRRHCSGNVSTTQQKAHKTPAAATARTPKSGVEITADLSRRPSTSPVTERDADFASGLPPCRVVRGTVGGYPEGRPPAGLCDAVVTSSGAPPPRRTRRLARRFRSFE